MPETILRSVGSCIYCGSRVYANDSTRTLGREHIIPEAISGALVLNDASCRNCERTINPWEARLLKGVLLGAKTYLGLRTKRPGERPTSLPLFDPRPERRLNGRERRVEVRIDDYPISIFLVKYSAPGILNPAAPMNAAIEGGWLHSFVDVQWDILRKKYDLPQFAMSSLDTVALCRTLAKIAHAYVIGSCDVPFIPTLPYLIMGNFDTDRRYYIGGLLHDEPPSDELHELSIEPQTVEQWRYVVVRIRLFAIYGAPTYRVVAGRRINPNRPVEVLLEEAVALRNSDRRPYRYQPFPPIPEGLWDPNVPFFGEALEQGPPQYLRLKVIPNQRPETYSAEE